MALWGKTDALASAPKNIARKTSFNAQAAVDGTADMISLENAGTNFATGDGVVYTGASGIGLTDGTTYYVKRTGTNTIQLVTTEAGAKAGATGINLTAGATGAVGYLQRNQEGNESTAENNGDHIYNGHQIIFVDADEASQPENRARGIKSPGWWSYRTWTNGDGSVQHSCEQLVAMGAYTGATGFGTYQAQTGDQATDDTVALDSTVSITVQPANVSVVEPATATFSVTAAITGAGTLTYQWQVQEGGAGAWTNVSRGSGGTTASYTTGVTQVAASGTADSNGDKYRCIVGSTTANTDVTSTAATLTVTA